MVESSAGAPCRCQGAEDPSPCCSPHVFTSALLGALACVLMTGGVFLAFHRWDPLWLIVSAVGVVLVLIGSLLHCCGAREARAARRAALGPKSCCGRPLPEAHIVPNGGSLTEQLLPLSNARSVSQLSLNMLPGYFPPVVTTYGIEQHSAVVQNINRLVQQQQPPASPGSVNPNGKSFILLSLPGDTSQANIQNLVATVYQLDGNVVSEIPATDGPAPTLIPASPPAAPAPPPPVLKNAEVQTCNVWPVPNAIPAANSNQPVASTSTALTSTLPPEPQPSTSSGTTQTEPIAIDLMDCSPICDTLQGNPDIPSDVLVPVRPDPQVPDIQIRVPDTTSLLDLPTPDEVLVEIPAAPETSVILSSDVTETSVTSSSDVPETSVTSSTDVLIDISEDTTDPVASAPPLQGLSNSEQSGPEPPNVQLDTATGGQVDPVDDDESLLGAVGGGSDLSLSCDNLSDIDVDDGELLERSSPPPSYDDVAQEGLGYGTI